MQANSFLKLARIAICVTAAMMVADVSAQVIDPQRPVQRALEAYKLRFKAALDNFNDRLSVHPENGDDDRYANRINSYTKGLPHDSNGIVNSAAYNALLHALSTGKSADFEVIPLGTAGGEKFRNPQAGYTYFYEGKDSHAYTMPAAPAFSSAWNAADSIEVMWQALARDVAFSDYGKNADITAALADMNHFSDYRGPRENGVVSVNTLFRGVGIGETVGPYISQFLLQSVPYGATKIEQRYSVPVANSDYLTNWNDWLLIQNGGKLTGLPDNTDPTKRYIRNGRDMAQYVLKDFINQAYINAALILNGYGTGAVSDTNPYKSTVTQANGPLFSVNHVLDMLGRVAMASQDVAWYQKWLVHRRARPEVLFARVHKRLTDPTISYPLHPELVNSSALNRVYLKNNNGSYLLPLATPAGSPLHPSYPAGHATMAGASVTMLKAFYKGSFVVPNTVEPNSDGTALVPRDPQNSPTLTVEGELNKLASNISLGRDFAGVHYRSDGDLGIKLGEDMAISILQELVNTFSEDFAGFSFNRFDGTPVTIIKTP
jgi:hypothetical protein